MSQIKSKIISDVFVIIKNKPRQTASSQQITDQIIQKLPVSRSTTVTFDKVGKYIRNNLRLKKNTHVLNLNGVFNSYNSFRENIRTNVFENFMKQTDEEINKRIDGFGEMIRAGGLKLKKDKEAYFNSTTELINLQRQIDHRVYVDTNNYTDKIKLFLSDLQHFKETMIEDEMVDDKNNKVKSQTQNEIKTNLNTAQDETVKNIDEEEMEDEFEFSQIQIQSQKIKSKIIRSRKFSY